MRFLSRVIDIDEQRNAEQAQYIKMCRGRLSSVPRSWELLTSDNGVQSFLDNHGQIRYFDVQTGREIDGD